MEPVASTKTQEQKDAATRDLLFTTYHQQYMAMSDFLKKLPINPNLLGIILTHLDTSFLWAKESFNVMQFSSQAEIVTLDQVDASPAKDELVAAING